MTDRFPLRSKLLAVPELKAKYLANLKSIAANDLSAETFGTVVAKLSDVIAAEVKKDSRKLTTNSAFEAATKKGSDGALNKFAAERSKYLLEHPLIKELER